MVTRTPANSPALIRVSREQLRRSPRAPTHVCSKDLPRCGTGVSNTLFAPSCYRDADLSMRPTGHSERWREEGALRAILRRLCGCPPRALVPLISSAANGFGREVAVSLLSCCLWSYPAPSRGFRYGHARLGSPTAHSAHCLTPALLIRKGQNRCDRFRVWAGPRHVAWREKASRPIRFAPWDFSFRVPADWQTGSEPGGLRGPNSGSQHPELVQTLPVGSGSPHRTSSLQTPAARLTTWL